MTTTRPPRQPSAPPAEVDLDLDALRAARPETKTKTFRAGGDVFTVPAESPVYVSVHLSEGNIRDALRLWLGDAQEAKFAELGVSDSEVGELLRRLYGPGTALTGATP